jgi:hypothetical protein
MEDLINRNILQFIIENKADFFDVNIIRQMKETDDGEIMSILYNGLLTLRFKDQLVDGLKKMLVPMDTLGDKSPEAKVLATYYHYLDELLSNEQLEIADVIANLQALKIFQTFVADKVNIDVVGE